MANKVKKYLLFIILSFFVGLFVGYYSTIFLLRAQILDALNAFKPLASELLNFTPRPNFLSDVAAFEAIVISIAIPLSFEIIARISERYQSDVLTKRFGQEWVVRWLPLFLIGNIVVAITLRFFVKDVPVISLWKPLAWLTLIGFLFVSCALLKFFILLKKYMTEIEFILNRLFDEAEKSLK